jgi:hypothetical protein
MPERRDYLLRMIEQVSRVLARVRDKIARGENAAARDELRGVVRQAGLELDMVKRMSPETLLGMLTMGSTPDPARCLLVAEVLAAEADRAAAANEGDDVVRLRAKAVELYRAARPHIGRDDQEIVDRRIAELSERRETATDVDHGATG